MNKITSELLNIKQAAAFLRVNPGTIRRWALANTLKGIKVGSRGDWRFKQEEYNTIYESQTENKTKKWFSYCRDWRVCWWIKGLYTIT